jgi:hypothetical protein
MPQQQHQVQVHAAHTAQQYMEPHHGYVQDRSGSSLSAAMSATSGMGLHAHSLMQQQPAKPATLSKAVAGVMATPKGWQERVDKMTVLSDALNRQVCWGVVSVRSGPNLYLALQLRHLHVAQSLCGLRLGCKMVGLSLSHCACHDPAVEPANMGEVFPVPDSRAGAGNTLLPCGTEFCIQRLCCSLRWTRGLRPLQRWRGWCPSS